MSKGTVLITGASSGIGEALAKQFAHHDYDLIITARREEKLKELAAEVSDAVEVHVVTGDLGTPDGAAKLISDVESLGIDVDILVNNAGIAHNGAFLDMDQTTIDSIVILNIHSLTMLSRHFAATMSEKGLGRILNVASVAAFQPVPSLSVYAASKAYVLSLTEALSEEFRGTGVHVTALCPGLTKTEMVDDLPTNNIPPMAISTAEEVAREGYDAVMNREVIRIPGVLNQAAVTWAQFQPRWLVRGLGGVFARINPNR